MTKKVGIVLSTYNGKAYIHEQLDSLLSQTISWAEIHAVDDCSTDGTDLTLLEYGHMNESITVEVNSNNKGWKRNFYDLLISDNHQLIFPCDQDDIWAPDKIEKMVEYMCHHPEIDVLASAVEPFGDSIQGRAGTGVIPKDYVKSNGIYTVDFSPWSLYVQRPGCSYCVRKSFIDQIKYYWKPTWPHDAVLWRFAAAKGSLGLIDEKLIRFRRHGDNASDRKRITKQSRIEDIDCYLEMLDKIRIFIIENNINSTRSLFFIDKASHWFIARKAFLKKGSLSLLRKVLQGKSLYATQQGLYVDIILSISSRITL